AVVSPGKTIAGSAKTAPSRRISPPVKEEKPVIIGKRVIERETPKKENPEKKVEKPKVDASKLIDQAISKIERKVQTEKKDHLSSALSKIQSQVEKTEKENPQGDLSETGISIRLYQMEVAERIKQNWSYPMAISNPGEYQAIEAVVVVTVRENGTIIRFSVKKKSSSTLFDASVLKAIERSDPLPPFPEGYRKSTDDIEIRFNLSDMETS
ncbi:MAG TPA: TonB family protein, partial [Deltaproteobacteria bacterium]|nr:TonB family protein [Deltaproteobacteria bacterium]